MSPTAVLFFLTATTTIMATTNNTLQQNNISTIGGSGGSVASTFGIYQQTAVGLSDLSIRTLVPDPISAELYRKALTARLFFHQILSLADYPSIELNDILSTIASYFSISTGSAARDADTAAQSISRSFFHISNLTGVAFSDVAGKSIKVPDTTSRLSDLTFFTFRSNVLATTVDIRAPNKSLNLDFLRLLQSLSQSTLISTATDSPVKTTPPSTSINPQTVEALGFTLGNLSYDILSSMTPDELRNLVITARETISVPPINLFSIPTSISFVAHKPSVSPKIDRVHSVAISGGFMTYIGPLDFLDFQSSFDTGFGDDPTMLRLNSRNRGQYTGEDTEYFRSKVIAFSNICRLNLLCDSVQLEYIGTEDYDSQNIFADISLALSKLKMNYIFRKKQIYLTPDDLFGRFTEFLPLLSPNAMTW